MIAHSTCSWRIGLAALAATFASAAQAHDFFLLPDRFQPPAGSVLTVRATVGSPFPNAENSVAADRVERLYARGAGSPSLRIGAAATNALNLQLAGARPGAIMAAVRVRPRDVDYGEDRIPLILQEYRVGPEALAAVEALPRPRTLPVVSRRFAKTLLCVRTCGGWSQAERPLGVELEFVPLGADRSHFRLLRQGQPLVNYPVDLVSSGGARQHLTTDARGDVHVPGDARGAMMLFAAVLTPPSGAGRFTLDLSTLTFSRP